MGRNVVQLEGQLLIPASIEYAPDGARRARLLVLVRSERRYRVDVIPVVASEPETVALAEAVLARTVVRVTGALMRRCGPHGPTRLEVVADSIELPDLEGRADAR